VDIFVVVVLLRCMLHPLVTTADASCQHGGYRPTVTGASLVERFPLLTVSFFRCKANSGYT